VTARRGDTGRALGVDLGSKRIGLALTDPSRTVASPHAVLERDRNQELDHLAIVAVAREAGATAIVVGLPRSLSGREGPAARAARAEAEALQVLAGPDLDVVLHDERLTTVEAERALIEGGVRRDARRKVVDKVAAAVMLQSWLERGGR
jgi:putative Holliday junction resolvase